jgi:hypothetical protein
MRGERNMIDTKDINELAKKAAGNWQRFQCFAWFRQPEDAENWTIVYTSNRDSGPLDRANAAVIGDAMEPFAEDDDSDVAPESHDHWAVGHVDGYSIRVYRDGAITEAFQTWVDLQERMDDYPILDEGRYSAVLVEEQEESWENWARHDFVRAIEKEFDAELTANAETLRALFDELCERSNTYWEDHGSGVYIDISRILKAAEWDDIRPLVVEQENAG